MAELNEKSRKKALDEAAAQPDGVNDSAYIEGTKETSSLAWVWILIILAVVVASIWLVVVALNKK